MRAKITPEQYRAILRRDGGRCLACGRRKDLQLDHVIPVALGGTDDVRNLQMLCGTCNRRKSAKTIDYRGWRGSSPLRLYRRFKMWRWTPMLRPVLKFLAVVTAALILLVSVPIVPPLQLAILAWLYGVWQTVRMIVYVTVGVVALVFLASRWHAIGWIYPDEYGQWPIWKGYLKRHPEVTLTANANHQTYRITQARRYIGERVSLRFDSPKDVPALESIQELPQLPGTVRLSDVRDQVPPGQIAFGVQPGGKLLSAPFGASYHKLFHGPTGGGKTNAIDNVITQLHHMAASGAPLTLYAGDFKREFAATWGTSPLFPWGIETEPAAIADLLKTLVHDPEVGILARQERFVQAARETGRIIRNVQDYEEITGERLPRSLMFVDELNAVLESAGRDTALESALKQALQLGRSSGTFIFAGAQHLTAKEFGRDGSRQFITRAHFGAYDQAAVSMIFGRVDHAQLQPYIDGTPGRGLIRIQGQVQPVPVQALRCDERDILEAIQAVKGTPLPPPPERPALPVIVPPASTWTPQHEAVADYLDEHPDASQREVARMLWPESDGGGRRGIDAGKLMRAVRNVPDTPNSGQTGQREHELVQRIRELDAQGLSQNRIIEQVFSCKKGGSPAYIRARALYRQALELDAASPMQDDDDDLDTEEDDTAGVSGVSEHERLQIITLAQAGVSRSRICRQVYGSIGRSYDKVRLVLDQAGL